MTRAAGLARMVRVSPSRRSTLATSACLAGVVITTIAAVAAFVAAVAAPAARRWLGFPFAGVPPTAAEALEIFAHNLRVLAGVVGLLVIAQAPLQAGVAARGAVRALRWAGETLIAGIAAANVLVIGASLGAYGARMLEAMLLHGPIELAAYSLALALYTQGRLRPLAASHALKILAACTALLALGAGLEVFAAP